MFGMAEKMPEPLRKVKTRPELVIKEARGHTVVLPPNIDARDITTLACDITDTHINVGAHISSPPTLLPLVSVPLGIAPSKHTVSLFEERDEAFMLVFNSAPDAMVLLPNMPDAIAEMKATLTYKDALLDSKTPLLFG